ncbi:hypothetical protein ACHAXA_006469 [Cyclostephanos tholiformis]|uniref:Vesicle-fusing ATPase n=1 Tax=Cyclostephanos tholiformis TaxID=382380 RepID=A0ABD3R4D4_9STRA
MLHLLSMVSGPDVKYGNQISHVETDDQPAIIQPGDASTDFQLLIQMAIQTLVRSDTDGDELVHSYGSASQGLWLNLPAAKELQGLLDRVALKEEEFNPWLQWMKTAPSPLILNLTTYVHDLVIQNEWVSKEHLSLIDTSLGQYISRIVCRVILLPSRSETASFSLVESAGAHVFGKLLYGGVSRYRLLKSGRTVRRVGESREVMTRNNRQQQRRHYRHPSWVQLGGLQRKYEVKHFEHVSSLFYSYNNLIRTYLSFWKFCLKAIDMGPAAILELALMPKQWQDLPTVFDKNVILGGACGDMTIAIATGAGEGMNLGHSSSGWHPSMLQLFPDTEVQNDTEDEVSSNGSAFQSLEGKERKDALVAHFRSSVGGLQPQIDSIVRRVLDGRSIYSTHAQDDSSGTAMSRSNIEAKELLLLGLQPVRGLLLYGPSGVGKTLIVREIASLLSSRPPKIVAASELLDRWVGGSERLVRELFFDAEQELMMCRLAAVAGDEDSAFLNSALHVIVIDEIDAVFRKRAYSNDSGSNVRNSVVNQLLSKLDGVNALPNVLMIGMTNRRELVDPALLRAGRLEVQIEIPLPKRSQRREILQIHFGALRKKNRLSFSLCCAIDGVASICDGGDIVGGAQAIRGRKRRALKQALCFDFTSTKRNVYDLADETEGFSGADIEGLVRCAGSRALSRARTDGGGVGSLIITLDDVKEAIEEVKA